MHRFEGICLPFFSLYNCIERVRCTILSAKVINFIKLTCFFYSEIYFFSIFAGEK